MKGLVGFQKIGRNGHTQTLRQRELVSVPGLGSNTIGILGLTNRKVPERRELDGDERKETDTPTCWKPERDQQRQQLIPRIFKRAQRSDRLAATVFKRKSMITRSRTYLDLHHMSLGPAQIKASAPRGSVKSREFISENSLFFMHSCGLAQPFPKQGFHVSHFPGRGRLVREPLTKVKMTLPETGPGQIRGRSQHLALAPPAHLTPLLSASILSSSSSSVYSTL